VTHHDRVRRRVGPLGAALLMAQLAAGVALAAPGATPASVTATLLPGGSMTVDKSVETPTIPPNPDIVFLADTTSSMTAAIGNVQANVATILSTVLAAQPTAEFGVAHYTDQACADKFVLDQPVTASSAAVITAVNALTTPNEACNVDGPEDYINALYQLATQPSVGFRTGSTRIVVLFGDSSSHDPSAGITEAAAISALQAAGIRVVAVNIPGSSGYLFDGLDGAGQATAIASATGGVFLNAPSVSEISTSILAGLGNLPVTVTFSVTCDPGLSVDITPASQTVTSGGTTSWSEGISVDPANPGGATLNCEVDWLLDGMLPGPEFVEQIAIEVPGADLAIVKTGPTLVTEGDEYSYDLTVTNNGPADATDVVVVDPLPGNTTFVSADAGCAEASGTVTCTVGSLAAGDSAMLSITVVAGSAGSAISNSATVSAFQVDPDPSNNTSTAATELNHNPTCDLVTAGPDLWPPNHKMQLRTLTGAADIDGDPLVTTVVGVTQDEPLDGAGDGHTSPDAMPGSASDQVQLRAERSGLGDGRVYRISFMVEDGRGGSCTGTAIVGVPHDQGGHPAIDSGDTFVDFPVMTASTVQPAVNRERGKGTTLATPAVGEAAPSATPAITSRASDHSSGSGANEPVDSSTDEPVVGPGSSGTAKSQAKGQSNGQANGQADGQAKGQSKAGTPGPGEGRPGA
jgi:uncharacterized repeat protein (TIGR01451 family)